MVLYDYIIIGGGVSGLTVSLLLGIKEKRCLVIDDSVSLGGCNRVDRKNFDDYFTEHSCRIVTSAYINFKTILKIIKTNFDDLYVPYNFNISSIGGTALNNINKRDLFLFVKEFLKLFIDSKNGYYVSVGEFMEKNKMSEKTIDYIDRLCRLTDGAGKDNYTLYELLQLVNQQSLYKIYQPKYPNDQKLFQIWEDFLKRENVEILKNKKVEIINDKDTNNLTVQTNNGETFVGKNVILCIPPKAIEKILNKSNLNNVFMEEEDFHEYVLNNSYIEDIGITFHWKEKILLPKIYGFPKTDWKIGFIVNSDYTESVDKYTKTLISAVILDTNTKSKVTKKTVNETDNVDELISETFRQIKISFPNLQNPDKSILNPKVYKDIEGWKSEDSAYFLSKSKKKFLSFQSSKIKNLFVVGTLNGKSEYAFTSIESAVTNAMSFVNFIIPESAKPKKLTTLVDIISSFVLILIISILFVKSL